MPNPLFNAVFAPHAARDNVFLHLPDGDDLTYRGLLSQAAKMASTLAGFGLEAGDRVAIHVEKTPHMLALYAACVQGGFVFLPLNPAYTPAEVGYFLEDSGAALLITDPDDTDAWHVLANKFGVRHLTIDGFVAAATRCVADFKTVKRKANDIAAILYTSGTTGRSKGAALTQDNLLSNARALTGLWQFTKADVLLHALPIFHTHGLFVATNVMLLAGGSMIFLPKFDIDAVFDALPRATAMMGVPTFYTRMLSDPRLTAEATKHMRLFVSGSAPLLSETHTEFQARTGHWILERYGMTETNMITSNPFDGDRRTGTVGKALPKVEVRITHPATGETLPSDEIGRIEVRGPNVFAGYWHNPAKTAEDMRDDGFFITGDLGVMSPDGYIQIVGRQKDLIISGGFNIYPKEIETEIDDMAGVLESAVVGLPDADLGERVVCFVVAQTGATVDVGAIKAEVNNRLARFKQPRDYVVLDTLPRNAMGKVQKNLLKSYSV